MSELTTLPYRLRANICGFPYTGPATLEFAFQTFTDEAAKPFFSSTIIWSRATNSQLLTTGTASSRVDLVSINQSPEQSLVLQLNCQNVEPASWLSLLSQLAQVAHQTDQWRHIAIKLHDAPPDSTPSWQAEAQRALFSISHLPDGFATVSDFLYPGRHISVEVDFDRDLSDEEFAMLDAELQIWGCLLSTGGVRLDFSPIEEPLDDASFGHTTRLTASWIRYSKEIFEGPVEAVALLDHWLTGLTRRGFEPRSIEIF